MKILILVLSSFLFATFIFIYTWDIPVPEKVLKKEINILDFKK